MTSLIRGIGTYPAVWPLAMLAVFCPAVWLVSRRSPRFAARVIRRRARWLGALGIVGVACFAFTGLTYLHCAAFWDVFESREASVAALLRRGGLAYPGLSTQERYCPPYGPTLYLALAASQVVFGANVFATKLPAALANLISLTLFWQMVRRQSASRTAAWALTGLLSALLLALRQPVFWAKADSLVLCAVVTGLYAAFRPGWSWNLLLGVCTGLALDLKPHALAYFLPALVLAWQTGWRGREYAAWSLVAVGTAALPFWLLRASFPLDGYLGYLVLTTREGIGTKECLGYLRWTLMLTLLVWGFHRLTLHPRSFTPAEAALRRVYYLALGLAMGLIALPACSIGAGQAHLLPMFPSFLLAAGDRYSRTLRVRWRPAPSPLWVALACSTVAACLFVTVQTSLRMARFHADNHGDARACAVDVRRLLARYSDRIVLNGSGEDSTMLTVYTRHALVFAGHPIGLDAAGIMDYQRGGAPPPDFDGLVKELRSRRPEQEVVWLLPRDAAPFALANLYDASLPAYTPEFRRTFLERFARYEQTRFYDVYLDRERRR